MSAGALAALGTVLVLAPALPGIAARTTAALTGRRGAPVLQLYADLARLLRKDAVYSRTTSVVFQLAPAVVTVATLAAACLVPLDGRAAPFAFAGDAIAFAGLLALGRLALVLAALDTGSSLEGMGASREVGFAVFVEPALFVCFAALALATHSLSLTGMLGIPVAAAWTHAAASLAMVAVSLFVLTLAEGSRGPVEDPGTHLELTMIHEVMVLDASGPDLALLHYAGALKLAVFASLVAGLLLPRAGLPVPLAVALLVPSLAALAALVGAIEAGIARLRLTHVPRLLAGAAALAGLGVILLVR